MVKLTPEEEAQKRAIYERMSPRRRKWVDRQGYDQWDPFMMPKDPTDIRRDETNRTMAELVRDFFHERRYEGWDTAYAAGVQEMALGLMGKNDRFIGMYEFSLWYKDLLAKEVKDAD